MGEHVCDHSRKPAPVKLLRGFGVVAAVVVGVLAACAPVREPATSARVRLAAEREGELHLYGNTSLMAPVIEAFHRKHPKVRVTVEDMTSSQIADRVVAEAESGRPVADMVWSSAMDVQIKLINDGYAQAYVSPHRAAMPPGSVWRDQGFGVTAEPIGFAYNRRLLPADAVPFSHARLLELLQTRPELFAGRVSVYDAERSGVAMMHLSADTQIYHDAWTLVEALGRARPRLDTSGQRMMAQLAAGEMVLVHNVNQSFARTWAAPHPDVAVVLPSDYHLTVSRVGFITRDAAHPNAARLFLDYLLSREGQAKIAEVGIRPIRDDVGDRLRAPSPEARPIRVGPGLLANLDQERRRKLLQRWKEAMGDAPRAPADPFAP
jgi:iron(III) transport system substrate-binding protein